MKSKKSIAAAMGVMGIISIIGAATMQSHSSETSTMVRLRPSFFTANVEMDEDALFVQDTFLSVDNEIEIAELETWAVQMTMMQQTPKDDESVTNEDVTEETDYNETEAATEETTEAVVEVTMEATTEATTEAPTEAPANNYVISITNDEFWLLCRLIEAEAGDTDVTGRIIVANVIINRVRDGYFPNSVTGVVYSPGQFTPITNGTIWQLNLSDLSVEAVRRALQGEDYSQGATYFCSSASAAKGNWHTSALKRLFEYGGNVFFTKY